MPKCKSSARIKVALGVKNYYINEKLKNILLILKLKLFQVNKQCHLISSIKF